MTVAADTTAEPGPSPAEQRAERDYRFGLDLTGSQPYLEMQAAYLNEARTRLAEGNPIDTVLPELARGIFAVGYGFGAAFTETAYRPVTPAAAVPLLSRITRALVLRFGTAGA